MQRRAESGRQPIREQKKKKKKKRNGGEQKFRQWDGGASGFRSAGRIDSFLPDRPMMERYLAREKTARRIGVSGAAITGRRW